MSTETSTDILTLAEAARLIEAKQLSPVELTQTLLDRIEAYNPRIDAFITQTADLAMTQAKAAEAEIAGGRYRGPMHGIPFGLKDIYNTRGILTTGHSRTAIDNVPTEDAFTTAKLYEAGGVLMGKLSTHEYAHGGPSFDLPWPPARNPWNREHFTAGSSTGSGAALAAGFVLAALGSDTGGSIRGPAALCGIVGLKPTYGLVSRRGVMPNSFSFDHAGPMAWNVEDVAILLQAIAGYDAGDPASAKVDLPDYRAALSGGIKGLRIGLVRHWYTSDFQASDDMIAAIDAAAETFRSLGAIVEDVQVRHLQDYSDVKIVMAESELFSVHSGNLKTRPGDFGKDFLVRSLPACLFTGADYVQASRRRRILCEELAQVHQRYDLLMTAGAFGPAPRLDAHKPASFWAKGNLTSPFNVNGAPAIIVNAGFSASGLPLGLQIAGRPFEETTVLRAAHAFEQATPWKDRRPQLEAGPKPDDVIPEHEIPAITLDAATQSYVEEHARRAGLSLTPDQIAMLCEVAPLAMAMRDRLQNDPHSFAEEPASVFSAGK
jgi:aspartyl-tRNA(Asn)/glutamyl-tRNA(Gln) amidotransferase subunit A